MKRSTKWIYFVTLILLSLRHMILNSIVTGAILILFSIIALVIVERREKKRQFYTALRYLYVCTDKESFDKEMVRYQKSRLIRHYDLQFELLSIFKAYYQGERSDLITKLNALDVQKDLLFWKLCYLCLLGEAHLDYRRIEPLIRDVPVFFRGIAEDRALVIRVMINEETTLEVADTLREQVNGNLLVAELTQYMCNLTENERLKQYYHQGMMNLSKDLVI